MKISAIIARLLIGAVFVVSAIAKLWSIDDFELYVYSYGFFSLNLTYLLVRLCIGVEFALGVLAIVGWHRRTVTTLILAVLLFFCLFLGYAALAGRNDSCQCFGRLADMPPAVSLLKNAILIVLALVAMRQHDAATPKRPKLRRWLTAAIVAAALASPFIISVPDNWMFGPSAERYDADALQEVIDSQQLESGNSVLAFVTPGCPYCRMTRQKLDSMAKRHSLPDSAIVYIEPSNLPDGLFLHVTYGARPLVVLLSDGQPVATYHYRNINERQIVRTLKPSL